MIGFSLFGIIFRSLAGNADLINKLRTDAQLMGQKSAIAALNDLETLFRYLTLFGIMDRVRLITR